MFFLMVAAAFPEKQSITINGTILALLCKQMVKITAL